MANHSARLTQAHELIGRVWIDLFTTPTLPEEEVEAMKAKLEIIKLRTDKLLKKLETDFA